ncbi:hypothetical protein DOTSEDRAFT_73816 [Dothistroma septosporum NZE10]|uniref:Uncharacterized protein n=1 Tax=Dothistroma septosporum (strain NZE10 / CBS 128990) TaxID=675120 RepID=N1PFX3_DOTSN|nr:hypothetical protein DOTSEDRAFT_73816 [Dothistroma septosporum NZE10]
MQMFMPISLLAWAAKTLALSCSPSRPAPLPSFTEQDLGTAFDEINATLSKYFGQLAFDATNVAIEVTTSQTTLWSYFHSAADSSSQAGTTVVNTDTVFRLARVSKLLTTAAVLQLHDQGHIASLHDAAVAYIPELEPSAVEWGRVTIWDLLNNVAGVTDMYGYNDVLVDLPARQKAGLGLPPVPDEDMAALPACQRNKSIPCDIKSFLQWLRFSTPVFPPHTMNSNSNVGTSLLGILIARATGVDYEQYVTQSIIHPLNLTSMTFAPSQKNRSSVLRGDETWTWDVGVNNPSVGVYSSPRDLSILLRWLLKSDSLATKEATGSISSKLNLFTPGFYAVGSHSLIGMPWNIYRSTNVLPYNRPVTFNTVVGTLGPYTSVVVLVPEYDLAFSIIMNGALGHPHGVLNKISTPLIRAADQVIWRNISDIYAGTYESQQEGLNTSLNLQQDPEKGLYIYTFISNSTDALATMQKLTAAKSGAGNKWIFQLAPALLSAESPHETDGEIEEHWRWTYVLDEPEDGETGWNDWCLSSFDPVTYAGRPLTEVVFIREKTTGKVLRVKMVGWDVWLEKSSTEKIGGGDVATAGPGLKGGREQIVL